MIKLNEIRLGNYVKYEYGNPLVVTTDTFYWISECVKTEDDYEPIPLTEDILLKCGFEKLSRNQYYFKGFIIMEVYKGYNLYSVDGYFLNLKINTSTLNSVSPHGYIKHLHQLQNIYFALTNEELTINL